VGSADEPPAHRAERSRGYNCLRSLVAAMEWDNEPGSWRGDADRLVVDVEGDTDYWRVTRHGFVADDAHCYLRDVTGDFTATVAVTGEYASLYDQAGLMIRADEETWLKCGIEYVDGRQHASAVITREFSDWSVVPLEEAPETVRVRVDRTDETVEVFYASGDDEFTMIRQGYLSENESLAVGPMAAAPQGDGFACTFEDFTVE